MQEFCRLLQEIKVNLKKIEEYLMAEEKISCEVESPLMWLSAEGYPDNYALRIIVFQQRSCEGNWSSSATPELIKAIESQFLIDKTNE